MPNTLMLQAAAGRKNFTILIRGSDTIDERRSFNPENQGRLLAGILWNMVPWATVTSMMNRLNELEGMEDDSDDQ